MKNISKFLMFLFVMIGTTSFAQNISMRTLSYIFALLSITLLVNCKKNLTHSAENKSSLLGKWILVETLADPGDGRGKWTAGDKANYYYLDLKPDETAASNTFMGLGGLKKYKIVNDSVLNLIYANGDSVINNYRVDAMTLTLTGGCIEACGSKFKRANP